MARSRRNRRGYVDRGFGSWSAGKKVAAVMGGSCLAALTALVVFAASALGRIEHTQLNIERLSITDEIERGTGYLNVALFGVDSRDGELGAGALTDTIMIASLNRETLEVRLASIYRDTFLEMDDGTFNKVNAAHAFGGPEQAIATLNRNLDLNIQHYVTVNFRAMIYLVDALGGVDIDVQPEEVYFVNSFASATIADTPGVDTWALTEPGMQTLTGVQATAYMRIRFTTGDDFRRTERQRDVMEQVVMRMQQTNLSTINSIIDRVFPHVATNFTLSEILSYARDGMSYQLTETTGFPFDKTTDTLSGVGSVVIPVDLESNVRQLHEFFFGDNGYSPSSVVTIIANALVNRVGQRVAEPDIRNTPPLTQPDDAWVPPANTGTPPGGEQPSGTQPGGGGEQPGGTQPGDGGGEQPGGAQPGGGGGEQPGGGGGEQPGGTQPGGGPPEGSQE